MNKNSRYFVGISLPDGLNNRIIDFQSRFSSNRLPQMIEPHVTVKTKNGLTPDMEWIDKVRDVIQAYPIFDLVFDGVDSFSDRAVVIRVKPSAEVINLHQALFSTINPPEDDPLVSYFENDKYEPHVTLGMASWGMSGEELVEMRQIAERELTEPPSFSVEFIRIYQQVEWDHPFKKMLDIPLDKNGKIH